MNFRNSCGQILSSKESSVNSEGPYAGLNSSWPSVAVPGSNRNLDGSSLSWVEANGSQAWAYGKPESPQWDTDLKDPSCTWDLDLSQQLAAKLLMLDESSSSQMLEQQLLDHHRLTMLQDASIASVTSNPRFKTEICRNFKEKGTCLYGDLCQFAHGKHELRKDVVRHNKYKTKLCQKYWIAGYCAYGPRCNFIHQEKEGLAAIPFHELPASVRACYPAQPALFKTAADIIGMASNINIRKSSLGDSGDSGSDEVTVGTVKPRGLQVPVFYPREKTMSGGISSNRFGYANDFTSYGNQWGSAAPIGSGRPGPRVVWPGA